MEGEREGEKHRCVVASHAPPTGALACDHRPFWFVGRRSVFGATPARAQYVVSCDGLFSLSLLLCLCVCFSSYSVSPLFFTIRYDVNCTVLIDILYEVEVPLHLEFTERVFFFNHK